jgi:plastocyanin
MRHLAVLAAVYALAAVLVLPGTLFAQESAEPATETVPAEPSPAGEPAAETAPAQGEAAPAEPAPAPEPAPEPAPTAEPAPAPEAAPAPEPQALAGERDEAGRERKPKARAAADGSVTIADFSFSPGTVTVNVGDTVTWTNNGPTPHSATASDGSFDTGIFPRGQSRSHTFNAAGTFAYFCTPHPNMRGTVVVQAAQTGGGGTSGSGTAGSGTAGGATGEAAQSGGGPTLPNSGADAGALVVLGALMLLLGVAVQRRARAE